MKKILLIIAGTCLLAHAGEAGISFGAIPGGTTLGSLVSKPAGTNRVVAGVADPGPRRTSLHPSEVTAPGYNVASRRADF